MQDCKTEIICRNVCKSRFHSSNMTTVPFYCMGYTHGACSYNIRLPHTHFSIKLGELSLNIPISPPRSLTSAAPLPLILSHEFISIQGSKNTPWFVHKVFFFLHFKLLYNNWFPELFFFHFLFSLKSAMIKKRTKVKCHWSEDRVKKKKRQK